MKTNHFISTWLPYLGMNLLAIFLFLGTIGCDVSDSGGTDRNTLIVSPRTTNMLTRSSAIFTATTSSNQNVALPLRWSIDDPSLGRIVSARGNSAIYQSNDRTGANTITVRDQGDLEGIAQIIISAPEVETPPAPIIITNAPPEVEEPEPVSPTVNIILPDDNNGTDP